MENLQKLKGLEEAIKLIRSRRVEAVSGSHVIWNKLNNAFKHLDQQIAELLAE